jgi:hypothetical protein
MMAERDPDSRGTHTPTEPSARPTEQGMPPADFTDLTLAEALASALRRPRQVLPALSDVLFDSSQQSPAGAGTRGASQRVLIPAERRSAADSGAQITWASGRPLMWLLFVLAAAVTLVGSGLLARVSVTGGPASNQALLTIAAIAIGAGLALWSLGELAGARDALAAWWHRTGAPGRGGRVFYLVPALLLVIGTLLFVATFSQPPEVVAGVLLAAAGCWVLGAIVALLIALGQRFFGQSASDAAARTDAPWAVLGMSGAIPRWRWATALWATILTAITWLGTSGNAFGEVSLLFVRISVIWLWLGSIVLWAITFAPLGWHPRSWARGWAGRVRAWNWRGNLPLILLVTAIVLVGAWFRLDNLAGVPAQMTSDHVEKLLDAQRVLDGSRPIFFENNGGREPFQMYAMAALAQWPGLGINHFTLKLLSALEAILTIPLMVWMGVEVLGPRHRRIGLVTGLVMAALLAASYWHVSLARMGLRIVLTPAVIAMLAIYLSRAMRHNHRADFIKAGLVLGFGLYAYQAIRMAPLAVLVGVGISLVFYMHGAGNRLRMIGNLAVLVLVAFVVFLPMFHYSLEVPEQFWERTTTRLLGDSVIFETQADGIIRERYASLEERFAALGANLPVLTRNIGNALGMFHLRGDIAWINGASLRPAMDFISGAFLLLGVVGWGALTLRSRDPVYVFMPLFLLIMLLPSALALAFPIENPSFTRTSGALPIVLLFTAFSVSRLAVLTAELFPERAGRGGAALAVAALVAGSLAINTTTYFGPFDRGYRNSVYPYSEAGTFLRGFTESGGAFGNAFVIAYPHWWDHRALAIEAGVPSWANTLVDTDGDSGPGHALDGLPEVLEAARERTGPFRLNPVRDLLFFYSVDDETSLERLKLWFPDGYAQAIDSAYPKAGGGFMTFRVPAPLPEGLPVLPAPAAPDETGTDTP